MQLLECLLFRMRFRAGGGSKVNDTPLLSHHVVFLASVTLKCSCSSHVEWVCTEVPPLCLPAIHNSCKLFECIAIWYALWGQIISFMYCDCYSILFSFLLTRNKGVACSFESKWGAEIVLLLLIEAPSFCRKCYCKPCSYKWRVSSQDIPVSVYEVTKCSFSIQRREPMEKQVVKDTSRKSGKSMGH